MEQDRENSTAKEEILEVTPIPTNLEQPITVPHQKQTPTLISDVIDKGREERINTRKNRIEAARLARYKPKDIADQHRRVKKVEVEEKDSGRAKSQISLSKKIIYGNRENGTELVSNIKAGVTARESLRRQEETRKIRLWKDKEEEEKNLSAKLSEQTDAEWKKLESCNVPHELFGLLKDQKVACEEILKVKEALFEEYVVELKSMDDEYVRELKRQSEEIDKLLDRMESQHKNYQHSLIEEIEQIEKAFVEERTDLIQTNKNEIEKCFENRRNNEAKFMNEKSFRIDDYMTQLEQLRVSDSEEYNLVKIKLETDVQVLEQQLQQMRVTYLLNIEKLEYNYQVLKKREEENGTILGAQKRKINRLADHLNILRIKSAKQEKTFQQENQSLTDDYKHLTEQYKELQKKFHHFQLADSKKFKEIWKMNEDDAKEIMRKVLQADRIIHEQQLGLDWTPPAEDLFKNVDPLIFHRQNKIIPSTISDVENLYENEMGGKAEPKLQENMKESLASKFQGHKNNSKTMKLTLELLCNEAGFLVEDKLQKLLEPLHRDEQSLMRLDSIFKALGVETIEDIERLTSHFVNEISISSQDFHKSRSQLIIDDNCKLIHPDDVVLAIRSFVEKSRQPTTVLQDISIAEEIQKSEREMKEQNQQQVQSQESARYQLQKQYWERMANVLDKDAFRVWNAVYVGMEKYHQELVGRYNLSNENLRLSDQNEELKTLLRQYMSARVNDELQIPPSRIMLAQAGMLGE